MLELKHYIEAFSHLHTAKVKGHKAPHKAVLLLAVIDLVEEDIICDAHIELTDALANKFNEVWHRYLGMSSIFTPDIAKPYFHMQHESFWKLVPNNDVQFQLAAESSPFVTNKEQQGLPVGSYSIKAMRNAFAYAEIDNLLFTTLQNSDARAMLRVILINEYLTNQPTRTMPDIGTIMSLLLPIVTLVA